MGGVAALLATMLVVGLAAWRHVHGRLLDGTEVVLQKVSYGTNHTGPKVPIEALLRHLPANWYPTIHWTPGSARTNASARPIFTFWLNFSTPAATSQSITYALADERGFEVPMIFEGPYGSYEPGGFSKSHGGLVRGTGTFPHRSRKFFLRLYQQAGNGERVRVAEFPVRNIGFQNCPHWTPQVLPVEHQNNGFTFALVKAEVGVTPPGPLEMPYDAQTGEWSEFRFRVSTQGQRCAGWSVNEMIVSDPTGNRLRVSGEDLGAFNHQLSRVEGDEIVCLHRWEFWAEESAWRLRVHFERPTTNECWVEYLVRPTFLNLPRPRGKSGEQTAAPNGGPATPHGNSGVREEPPSVS